MRTAHEIGLEMKTPSTTELAFYSKLCSLGSAFDMLSSSHDRIADSILTGKNIILQELWKKQDRV